MSKYDYYCPKCDKIKIDIEHGMNETPEIKCECGETMRKKVTAEYFWHYHPLKWSRDYSAQKSYGGKKQ